MINKFKGPIGYTVVPTTNHAATKNFHSH